MSKKYDNNLNEIKDNVPIKTFSITSSGANIENLGQPVNIDTYEEENKQLKQQLAEKEGRIKYLEMKWAITKDCLKRKTEAYELQFNKGQQLKQQLAENAQHTEQILKENAQLKQTVNTLQQNSISGSVDDVNLIHELENQLAECKEKLEESFCQEDIEGLIKDRDITIKSLKEQLTGYQQELETYKKKPINVYQMEIRNLQVDKAELKLEIEEKDEEIEKLKLMIKTLPNHDTEMEQLIRHQICEEIKIKGYYCHNGEEKYYKITPEMLWEIEKGE